jgi:integrase/recombinase XerD
MNALSASDILTKDEVLVVLERCRKYRRRKKKNNLQNEIVFRLAVGCGLRVGEICKLAIGDLVLSGPKPSLRVWKKNVKGKTRMRTVPLWWDEGTLAALSWWVDYRREMGATAGDPLICVLQDGKPRRKLYRHECAKRWKATIRVLGEARVRQLSIHCGRHTFASHALNVGRSLVEVQSALGHSSLTMTSRYAHLIEREGVKGLYT